MVANVTIAAKRRRHVLMAEILRPSFVFLWPVYIVRRGANNGAEPAADSSYGAAGR